MAKNKSVETFEKRRRERAKQMKQQAKVAERQARKAEKRAEKARLERLGPDAVARAAELAHQAATEASLAGIPPV